MGTLEPIALVVGDVFFLFSFEVAQGEEGITLDGNPAAGWLRNTHDKYDENMHFALEVEGGSGTRVTPLLPEQGEGALTFDTRGQLKISLTRNMDMDGHPSQVCWGSIN